GRSPVHIPESSKPSGALNSHETHILLHHKMLYHETLSGSFYHIEHIHAFQLQTKLLAKIVESTCDFHHHILKLYACVSQNIFDDATSLSTRNNMFNNNP